MVFLVDRDHKECEDLLDNLVPRDPLEGQVAKDHKEQRARKVQGEKKDLEGSLAPRENRDLQENQGRTGRLDRLEKKETRVHKELQEYLARKEIEGPRGHPDRVDPLVLQENLDLPDQPEYLVPKELLAPEEKKGMMENVDYRDQQGFPAPRAFRDRVELRVSGVPADRRDRKVYQDHADLRGQQDPRVTKERQGTPEEMVGREARVNKVQRAI